MQCPHCNTQNPESSQYCVACGKELPQRYVYPRPERPEPLPGKGIGITSMVTGIFSVIPFIGIPLAIIGFILGIVANKQAKDVGRTNTFAKVGLICSVITLVGMIILWLILYQLAYSS